LHSRFAKSAHIKKSQQSSTDIKKTAEFDADFESVEKAATNRAKK
jgi:hypothetical protein